MVETMRCSGPSGREKTRRAPRAGSEDPSVKRAGAMFSGFGLPACLAYKSGTTSG